MLVFRGLPAHADVSSVLTIGNFDGVHRGHQALLERLVRVARERALPATVLTFEPHPREFFAPDSAPPRLSRLREKLELLAEAGVDRVFIIPFDAALAALEAEAFIEQVLVRALGTRYLLIGDDFCFGRARRGNFAMLQDSGRSLGFQVESMPTLVFEGERVSSSAVRETLMAGDLEHAERLIGRPYTMSGRVMHGDKLGRTLGFPTANIQIKRSKSPLMGIFTVTVDGLADAPWPGVASLGVRPTVTSSGRATLEVFLFDFDGDLYGRHLRVNFLHKQRDEAKFDSLDALKAAIWRDCDIAREILAQRRIQVPTVV
ncbi:bifunctional riboflavin kinase/FAD synthetase [Niveibacterium sp. SC-1]|uniref:bifunctional riboflavin kinase/FAD synthetase n=1 Tax=Niveibacterium sp. SC-1 TaxID=3135646 RepID=UPI00311D3C37